MVNENPGDILPILDLMQLADFSGGDSELAQSFLCDFFMHSHACLEEMAATIISPAWKGAAHRLKGAASSIGAKRLAYWAGRAEQVSEAERASVFESVKVAYHELSAYCSLPIPDK